MIVDTGLDHVDVEQEGNRLSEEKRQQSGIDQYHARLISEQIEKIILSPPPEFCVPDIIVEDKK